MNETSKTYMQFYFSSKRANIHPKKSNTIPRFYSNWAIFVLWKRINLSPEKKLYHFLVKYCPKKNHGLGITNLVSKVAWLVIGRDLAVDGLGLSFHPDGMHFIPGLLSLCTSSERQLQQCIYIDVMPGWPYHCVMLIMLKEAFGGCSNNH
jgi:hypothetical protein